MKSDRKSVSNRAVSVLRQVAVDLAGPESSKLEQGQRRAHLAGSAVSIVAINLGASSVVTSPMVSTWYSLERR